MVLPRDEIRASRGCPSLWTLDPVGRASLGGACGGGDGELSRECGCAGLKVAMRAVVPPRVWPQRAAEASPRSRCGGGSGPLCRLWVDSGWSMGWGSGLGLGCWVGNIAIWCTVVR
jgi:hypothetical protein